MLVLPKNIAHPARYLGIEPGRVMKDGRAASVRFALCYPDIYEIGMSYLGFFLLYEPSTAWTGYGASAASRPGSTWKSI